MKRGKLTNRQKLKPRSLAHLAFNLNDEVTKVDAKDCKILLVISVLATREFNWKSEHLVKSPVLIALAGILQSLGAMQQ